MLSKHYCRHVTRVAREAHERLSVLQASSVHMTAALEALGNAIEHAEAGRRRLAVHGVRIAACSLSNYSTFSTDPSAVRHTACYERDRLRRECAVVCYIGVECRHACRATLKLARAARP